MHLKIQHNPNPISNMLFCGYQQSYLKVYVESQKSQNSQHSIEEKQNWRSDITQLHLLQSHSNQESLVSLKE